MAKIARVVVFALLFWPVATIAQTTSGWVLWEKNMMTRAGVDSITWEPMDGFESIAECRQTGQQLLQNAVAYLKTTGKQLGPVRPDGRSAIFEVTNAKPPQTIDTRFLCFPGTLDPRARQAPASAPATKR